MAAGQQFLSNDFCRLRLGNSRPLIHQCSPNAAAALLRKMAGFRLTLGSFMILGSSSIAKGSTCIVTSHVWNWARPAAHYMKL